MNKVALVIVVGDATGGAIARRFAREGYTDCVTRRSQGKLQPLLKQIRVASGKVQGFVSDAAGAKHALRALAQTMARELGPRGIHIAHGQMFWGQDRLEFVKEALS